MSIASSEQQSERTGRHRFGTGVPRSPLKVALWLAAAFTAALLVASRHDRSSDRVVSLDSPHPFLTQVKVSIDPLTLTSGFEHLTSMWLIFRMLKSLPWRRRSPS